MGDFAAGVFCDIDTLRERHAADRNERNDVCGSDAGMLASMLRQVDMPHCHLDAANRGFAD